MSLVEPWIVTWMLLIVVWTLVSFLLFGNIWGACIYARPYSPMQASK